MLNAKYDWKDEKVKNRNIFEQSKIGVAINIKRIIW